VLNRPITWLAATLGAGLAIALLLGGTAESYEGRRYPVPVDVRYARAISGIRRARRETERARLDLIVATARAATARQEARPFNADSLVDSLQALHDLVARGSRGNVPVLLAAMPSDSGTDATSGSLTGAWAVLPDAAGAGGCTVLRVPELWRRSARRRSTQGTFGPCRWYAIYGAPGRAMREYLATNTLGIIRSDTTHWYLAQGLQATPFLAMRALTQADGPRYVACSAYGGDRCRHVALRDGVPRQSLSMLSAQTQQLYTLYDWHPLPLVAIERAVGTERFAELWRSDGPFEAAYTKAVGEPVETTVRRRIEAELGARYVPGPGVELTTLLALLVVTLGGVALMAASRFRGTAT
jgi:hypothetical protein